jgi:hypothetical protein
MNDKCEPVRESIVDFSDEFLDFLDRVLFTDPIPERFSRQVAKISPDFWRWIVFQSFG